MEEEGKEGTVPGGTKRARVRMGEEVAKTTVGTRERGERKRVGKGKEEGKKRERRGKEEEKV